MKSLIAIHVSLALLAVAATAACGSGDDDDDDDDDDDTVWSEPQGACADDTRVGAFDLALDDGFTKVQGKVKDGVTPHLVPDVVASEGGCRLLQPPELFCDPACEAGTTCAPGNSCVTAPTAVSVGTVTVTGLAQPVEMSASAPVFFYNHIGELDHPGFAEGAEILLTASGEGDVAPFDLSAYGITALETSASSVALATDTPIALAWTPPGLPDISTVHVNLNIALHGGTPGWIECEAPDDGAFELPVALTNELLANGYSGFPALTLTRRSVDLADTVYGCVEMSARSVAVFEVEIEGLTSCSGDEDCSPPETCQPDLTCG